MESAWIARSYCTEKRGSGVGPRTLDVSPFRMAISRASPDARRSVATSLHERVGQRSDVRGPLLRTIPMLYLHPVLGFAQTFAYIFGDHDGATLAAGTAEGDGQIAFPLLDVVRQKIDEQL